MTDCGTINRLIKKIPGRARIEKKRRGISACHQQEIKQIPYKILFLFD